MFTILNSKLEIPINILIVKNANYLFGAAAINNKIMQTSERTIFVNIFVIIHQRSKTTII